MHLPRPKEQRQANRWFNKLSQRLTPRVLAIYLGAPIGVLFLLYVIFDFGIMRIITRHGSEFPLSDVTGKGIEMAHEMLRSQGLDMEVAAEEYHPDKPEGTILSQYPAPGTKVKSGRIIKVTASIGQKMVTIPALSGFSVRQAKLNLEASGLKLGEVAWTFSDSLPEKVVVFSYPASGTEIPAGSAVNLMVNRGRLGGVVYMPQLVGRQFTDAKKMLEELGLKVGLVTYVRNEDFLPETVLEQSAEEASELEPGEEIDLVVSTTE